MKGGMEGGMEEGREKGMEGEVARRIEGGMEEKEGERGKEDFDCTAY